ncbi:unnamed protein product [Leptidea sinapis]|uniref:Tc1-like transposase DDE domain-containing protein n=1 Tax=Leptidea sinapis TaxID=189913 RepID=A0A5E4R5J0_9NEOP|nr:unnamed protein product [Leptidea sinapis]
MFPYLKPMSIVCITSFRTQNRNIYFLDETYINASHHVSKCWQSSSEPGIHADIRKGWRLVILHAGCLNALVDNALTVFNSDARTGDYHGDMSGPTFYKWVDEKLKDKLLLPNSVVIMDNASYHSVQVEKKPTISSLKKKWQRCDDHVYKNENDYWSHDSRFDNVIDSFIINLQDSDSSSGGEVEDDDEMEDEVETESKSE